MVGVEAGKWQRSSGTRNRWTCRGNKQHVDKMARRTVETYMRRRRSSRLPHGEEGQNALLAPG